ncbi:MAG: AtpZ/AtpI family protein [Parcubacteria group bacterium]|nr:AtpZ/AtpI family protein [Parcubacteria group bacterium]
MSNKYLISKEIFRQAFLFNALSIAGPILFFGGIGWLLDSFFHTGRIFLFLSVAVAFIATHVLMFRKLQAYSKEINKIAEKNDTEKKIK